ncbi:DUF1963 domain-containing protein [Paenibacillus sp. FSL R5-0766]|uniref:DUF1963 domain-containing protein n=1 Tax=unclassified Paenibacillus TaxID=185978 RepID=UPI00096F34F4|nr:DUF1963 domain-containing protein [Paenibacillus sp. FSL R5-0765]OMF63492.1 DUF1963 domain-containing protein [Paenibacillus sp. FSL R5-0765]
MTERIPCIREGCANTILPATAARTGGYCMPCKQEMEREERQRYIEANRRDVNLYAGITDPVEILKIMHKPQVRDPLIRYTPYEQSEEQVYLSLSVEQQDQMKDYAMQRIRTGDEDTGKDILVYLVCYHDISLTAEIPELLEQEIYYPAILYKSASGEVRDRLLQQVNTDDENRNHILLMLAHIGDDVVVQQFRQWRQSPPSWASELYVTPEHYTTEAGWELTKDGQRRELFITPSYSLYKVKENEGPNVEVTGNSLSMLNSSANCCPWCGNALTTLISLDVKHPALKDVSWHAQQLQIQTCVICSSYGVVYMELDAAGEPLWSSHNVMPMGMDEIDLDDYGKFAPDVGQQFRIANASRHAFHASEWAMEPSLSQVGGHPGWVQDAEYPTCPSCSTRMKAVAQLDWGEVEEYGEGMYYMFICEPCQMTAVSYQQS